MVTVAAARAVNLSRLQALVKWLAVLTMVIDHVGAVLLPDVLVLRVIGRFAFPAFVGLIAANIGGRGVNPHKYLRPMVVWAAVSQVPFMLAGFSGLNIFVTLGLGILLWAAYRRDVSPWWALLLVIAPWVQYGPAGVLAVTIGVAAVASRSAALGAAVGALLLLAQGSVAWAIVTGGVLVADVTLIAIVIVATGGVPAIPRGPRVLFYAFYPAHLLLLVGIRAFTV